MRLAFGQIPQYCPIDPERVRLGLQVGLDTKDMASALNDRTREQGLPYEAVREADLWNARARAERLVRSAA